MRDVRAPATSKSGKYTETSEYFKFMRRVARGAAKRADQMDPEALAELSALVGEMREVETAAALALNEQGYSWAEIGAAQGISGSPCWRKYAKSTGRGASRKDLATAR